jgi:enoyl-CoA hydratase/carnithine racemase
VSDVVLIDVRDGVAVLTLNRPDRLNAWTGKMQVC